MILSNTVCETVPFGRKIVEFHSDASAAVDANVSENLLYISR